MYLPIYLSICLSFDLSNYLSIYLCLSKYLYIYIYVCADRVLPLHYLQNTSKTHHPSHSGDGRVSYTLHHAIYNVLLPIKYLKISCWRHTPYWLHYTLIVPATHFLARTHPTGGRVKRQTLHRSFCASHMSSISDTKPPTYSVHTGP